MEDDTKVRWNTPRNRDRNRARFLIRKRIAKESEFTNSTNLCEVDSKENSSCCADDDSDARLKKYFQAVALGSASTFSLRSLSRDYNLLSRQDLSIRYISSYKIQTLCTSRFGEQYAEAVLKYYNEVVDTCSIMEYASLLGEYGIVKALISGGINPFYLKQEHSKFDKEKMEREQKVSSMVVKRLIVEIMPITLTAYMIKCVFEMRMWGAVVAAKANSLNKNNTCPMCSCSIRSSLLLFSAACNHQMCATCIWDSLCQNLDERVEGDIVCCPICDQPRGDFHTSLCQNSYEKKDCEKDPSLRYEESLEKFKALPKEAKELRKLPKKKKSKNDIYSTWKDALSPAVGGSQDVREEKFARYIDLGAIHHVRACLEAGVDVNAVNEYNQTPLYIACWRRHNQLIPLLLDFGADVNIHANGGMSIKNVLEAINNDTALSLLPSSLDESKAVSLQYRIEKESAAYEGPSCKSPNLSMLISKQSDHAGAGSCLIDYILPESVLCVLESMWQNIPEAPSNEAAQKKIDKNIPCSIRSYFCDAEGYLTDLLVRGVIAAFREYYGDSPPTVKFLPQMRFLNYNQAGGELRPHIDLTRVDAISGKRSTHTFLLYLTDCPEGGETALLKSLSPSGPLALHEIYSKVAPRRGRLLLFPHACPHQGLKVISTPKVLVRGEVFIE